MSIRKYGYQIGEGRTGKNNLITDVPGVKVGHVTVDEEENKTGVTVIIPSEGSIFLKEPIAATYTLNGFGKTMGTIQIDELGTLETPIALTNTLNVGKVADGLVEFTLMEGKERGVRVTSVNAVGFYHDCNRNQSSFGCQTAKAGTKACSRRFG